MNFSDVRTTAIELTRFASITNSPGERDFAPFLAGKLAGMEYFTAHPEDLEVRKTADDPYDRSVIFAFVRGGGTDCLILTGHYDVVATGCYGELEDLAFEPEELTRALAAGLSREIAAGNPGESAARALADLESGDFLAGRGILDMKSGLAAGLAVLDRFAGNPARKGNLLFLAVPDEEDSSHGMRHAADMTRDFLSVRGCTPMAAINLDSAVDQDRGEAGRVIFLGSVGKLLPFVVFIGRPTHAGAPFDGINPALPASIFVRMVESDPRCLGEEPVVSSLFPAGSSRGAAPGGMEDGEDRENGEDGKRKSELPPPPTVLYLRETRTSYDVTTPRSVFCALNVLSHHRSPDAVLAKLASIAAQAMEEALSLLAARALAQSELSGHRFVPPDRTPVVLDFAQIAARPRRPDFTEIGYGTETGEVPNIGADPVLRSAMAAESLAIARGIEGPAAIIGFAPPYYPRAELLPGRDDWFLDILDGEAARMARETGESLGLRPYFPGISDMSHLSPSDGPGLAEFVASRSPLPMPGAGKGIGCPVVNIGPWGREYHQKFERVHAGYAFGILPELLWRISEAVFSRGKAGP